MDTLLAFILAFLLSLTPQSSLPLTGAGAGKTSGGGGTAPSFIKSCTGNTFGGTSQTCVFGSNVTNTSVLYATAFGGSLTTLSVAGCGATWTINTLQFNGATILEAWGIPSTGACTVTLTPGVSTTLSVTVAEYGPSTGGVDNMVNLANQGGFIGSGSTINCPAITTSVANERVICTMQDSSANGGTSTAGAGFTIDTQGANFGWMIESQAKAATGSITPTSTSSTGTQAVTGSIAIKP